ncbi:MAG: hypothetical protein V1926_01165 [Candidatus Peregrinibacteria bacterium]
MKRPRLADTPPHDPNEPWVPDGVALDFNNALRASADERKRALARLFQMVPVDENYAAITFANAKEIRDKTEQISVLRIALRQLKALLIECLPDKEAKNPQLQSRNHEQLLAMVPNDCHHKPHLAKLHEEIAAMTEVGEEAPAA